MLMAEYGLRVDALEDAAARPTGEANPPVFVDVDGELAGLLVVADPSRRPRAKPSAGCTAWGSRW